MRKRTLTYLITSAGGQFIASPIGGVEPPLTASKPPTERIFDLIRTASIAHFVGGKPVRSVAAMSNAGLHGPDRDRVGLRCRSRTQRRKDSEFWNNLRLLSQTTSFSCFRAPSSALVLSGAVSRQAFISKQAPSQKAS